MFKRSARWSLIAMLLVTPGCAPRHATGPSDDATEPIHVVPGGSKSGAPLRIPAGFDRTKLDKPFGYSPSGRYLGFNGMSDGSSNIFIVDLLSNDVIDYQLTFAGTERNDPMPQPDAVWLVDDHLIVLENWTTPEQQNAFAEWMQSPDPTTRPPLDAYYAYRVVDIPNRRTKSFTPLGLNGEEAVGGVVGQINDTELVALEGSKVGPSKRIIRCDPSAKTSFGVLFEASESERFSNPSGLWICSLAQTGSDPYRLPARGKLINLRTAEVREVSDVPTLSPYGPVVTDDGRYVMSAYFDRGPGSWVPTIMRTDTGLNVEVPDGESWRPVAASQSRGVVLASVFIPAGPQSQAREDWYEVPFAALWAAE